MKIETFVDDKKEHRWRLVAKNGRIVAVAGEGYKKRSAMMRSLKSVKEKIATAQVVEVE